MSDIDSSHSLKLRDDLKAHVLEAGIDLVGVTSAEPLPVRPNPFPHMQARELLPEARAIVIAGFCVRYEPRLRESEPGTPRGRFTPYGSRAFMQMDQYCEDTVTGFLKERGWASIKAPRIPIKPAVVRAGMGQYGKHSVVVTPGLGSWVMFTCFVTDAPLAFDGETAQERPLCPPDCRRCMEACPTGAITAPGQVDRRSCITDWLWGYFAPPEQREKQGNRLFGCGECLIACPQNRKVSPRVNYPVSIDDVNDSPDLIPLITGDEQSFRATVPAFTMQAGADSIRGNAIIALGNTGDPAGVEALATTLHHGKAQIRAYTAWSLGRIGGSRACGLLEEALAVESDGMVAEEIRQALALAGQPGKC